MNEPTLIYFLGLLILILLIAIFIINKIKKNERDTKNKFKNLFENMHEGFALHEIILDAQGAPVNYRFLDANLAFERITGLKVESILGRTVLEILPQTEKSWIETYGSVALHGQNLTFSNYSAALDKYFTVNVYCPAPNQFATVFTDITFEKEAQETVSYTHLTLPTNREV